MSNAVTRRGILGQLESMLTNHPERKTWMVEAKLKDSNDLLLDSNEFKIYAEDAEFEISDKVTKLRDKGGLPSLRILKLNMLEDGENRKIYLEVKI